MPSINLVVNVTGEPAWAPGESRVFTYAKLGTVPKVTLSLDDTTGIESYNWHFLTTDKTDLVEVSWRATQYTLWS